LSALFGIVESTSRKYRKQAPYTCYLPNFSFRKRFLKPIKEGIVFRLYILKDNKNSNTILAIPTNALK